MDDKQNGTARLARTRADRSGTCSLTASSSPSASPAMSRVSASRSRASGSISAISSSTIGAAPASPASMPSATCPVFPGLRHKASHEGVLCVEKHRWRRFDHPLDKHFVPACTYSTPRSRDVWLHRGGGAGRRPPDQTRPVSPIPANGKAIAVWPDRGADQDHLR